VTAANRTIILSMGVVLLGASSLLATPRRTDTCYLLDIPGEGGCPSQAAQVAACISVGQGCPSWPDNATCESTWAGGVGHHVIHCCFNGNDVGVCAD
jgi:hypothetical protein